MSWELKWNPVLCGGNQSNTTDPTSLLGTAGLAPSQANTGGLCNLWQNFLNFIPVLFFNICHLLLNVRRLGLISFSFKDVVVTFRLKRRFNQRQDGGAGPVKQQPFLSFLWWGGVLSFKLWTIVLK